MELAFIVNTTDDGVVPTEKIVNDDIVNISWAIPTNQHTAELVEYEAGVATFYRGAPGLDNTTPDAQWTVTQTLTKVLSVTQTKTIPNAIIPTQSNAVAKIVKLGEKDENPDLYWEWVQSSTQSEFLQLGIRLRRKSKSTTMTIEPGTYVQGKVGL